MTPDDTRRLVDPVLMVQKLHPQAVEPSKAHGTDAGLDLAAVERYTLYPGERHLIPTGIALQLPWGTVGLVHPRSGLANDHGVTVLNAPGVIDEGYTGEVMVNLINLGRERYTVEPGERIAQLIIQTYLSPVVMVTQKLASTARGTAGHGSTGR